MYLRWCEISEDLTQFAKHLPQKTSKQKNLNFGHYPLIKSVRTVRTFYKREEEKMASFLRSSTRIISKFA